MNMIEKIAFTNVKHAFNWIVGGYYNCLQDDTPEYLPDSKEALLEEIYNSALSNLYAPGYEGIGKAPKEMRFAGEKAIRAMIETLTATDGDFLEIAEYCNW